MPKFLIFSDLHLGYNRTAPTIIVPDDVDAVIVPGDIKAPVSRSMQWLDAEVAAQGRSVVFIAGNHEHYGHVYEASMASGRVSRSIGWRTKKSSSAASGFWDVQCGPITTCIIRSRSGWLTPNAV